MARSKGKPRAYQNYHEITFRNDWLKYRGELYFKYRKLWEELPRRRKVPQFPMHVDIDTTMRCNLACPMCARTKYLGQGDFDLVEDLSFEDYCMLVDQIAEGGTFAMKPGNLGEPLIHKDIIKQVKYAKDKGIEDLLINSNGTLLSEDKSAEVMEAGLDKMLVSFDSPYADEYEKIRVGANFSKTYENVKRFVEIRNKFFPHVFVRVSMVLFDWSPKSKQKIKDMVELFSPYVDALGMTDYVDFLDDTVKPKANGFFCGQLCQRLILLIDGKVVMCCTDDKGDYVVGDWRKESVKDIWEGKKLGHARQLHEKGEYYKIDMCKRCIKPYQEYMSKEEESAAKDGEGVFGDYKDQLVA